MNTKKKKQNRPKPPKVPQKLSPTESDKQEILDNVTTKSEPDSEKKEDSVLDTTVTGVELLIDKKIPVEGIPKKPERGKGKKKQESPLDKTLKDNTDKNNSDIDNKSIKTELIIDDSQKSLIVTLKDSTDKNNSDVDNKSNKTELIIDDSQESLIVTPTTRKKKNKDKKQSDTQEICKAAGSDIIDKTETNKDNEITKEVSESFTSPPQVGKIREQDNKITKKKKKKRNRHDSEKSDVNEDTPCTLAFKKLLESSENKDDLLSHNEDIVSIITSLDDVNVPTKDISLKLDVEETDINQNLKKDETKKKNKKHKQQQEKPGDICSKNVTEPSLSEDSKQEVDCSESHGPTSLEESSIKAKIAKPVDRKRKVKTDKQSRADDNISNKTTSLEEPCLTTSDKNYEITSEGTKSLENISKKITDTEELVSIIMPPILDTDKQEENLCKTLDNILLDNSQNDKSIDEFADDSFVEVKPAKKKKKQVQKNYQLPKVLSDTEVPVTGFGSTLYSEQNIVETTEEDYKQKDNLYEEKSSITPTVAAPGKMAVLEPEESNSTIPDIIQYPRSASQQLLGDNNNNTLIQEIPATAEIKLGIPICTSTPIIQGSGETPEAKLQQDPLRVKLTEIDSKLTKCVQEKTDIKSKMMEVNQDMEELRLSIERSLAELTALDKGDKEFEENFQENVNIDHNKAFIKEVKEDKSSISLPMPSSLVDKPATSSEDREICMKPKNPHVCVSPEKEITVQTKIEKVDQVKSGECISLGDTVPPVCPSRKDNKGKSKSKKKSKQESVISTTSCSTPSSTSDNKGDNKSTTQTTKEQKSEKSEQTQKETQEKGKQQSLGTDNETNVAYTDDITQAIPASSFEAIEKFEDALTSSVDDVNQSFEMIANEAEASQQNFDNPQINIIAPIEDEGKEKNSKENPVTLPKNLLGHPDIPVPSNKTDYKKEKNKLPNNQLAKVKIKDSVEIEKTEKISKQSQTYNKRSNLKNLNGSESFSYMTNGNNEFIYKYSFRKVFLQSSCHVCKKELIQRYPCKFCSLIFYCSQKHMDENWPSHQSLCFAVSTITHLKDQKHIYADAKGITGQDFRVLRMQMIVSCEKILKRKLVPWEQEALLYPRICADINCREWKQSKLKDCEGCEQISYCNDRADHLPSDHLRWCKSYALYQKLVNYQQTKGRLEPPMPTKILENYQIPEKINDVLASMYEEKIDMNDIQYAALTQLATAPLTVAYSHQLCTSNIKSTPNGLPRKTALTVHVVGAELQFEADGLNKWEVFLLHLRPEIKELRIVLVGPDLNPSNLPLDLLGKVKLCENCKANRRRVIFSFQDKLTYHAYYTSDEFIIPDIVCAFNPSIQRSSIYNGRDTWPSTIQCILKQKTPFVITSYTLEELQRDLGRVKEFGDYKIVSEAKHNPFASVRPDRNFITDHEIPLMFKNYCLSIVCAV